MIQQNFYAKKRKWKRIRCVFFILFLCLVFILSFIGPFVYKLYTIYTQGKEAQTGIQSGIDSLMNGDFETAHEQIHTAQKQFDKTYKDFQIFNYIEPISRFNYIENNRLAINNLLQASTHVSQSAEYVSSISLQMTSILKKYRTTSFKNISIEEKTEILDFIMQLDSELSDVINQINIGLLLLHQIPSENISEYLKEPINVSLEKIEATKKQATMLHDFVQLVPEFVGYPTEKKYLVLLLNNTELRPGGGFIGTYATIQIKDAEIKDLEVHDVYHLDKNAPDDYAVTPPEPLKKYLKIDKLYFRDSNWSPDFLISAQNALSLYHQEGGVITNFDGVIALNPTTVGRILDYFGGITYNGITYTSDNLVDILEYKVEQEFAQQGIAVEDRKQIIGFITSELVAKIKQAHIQDYLHLIELMHTSFEQKDIMMFTKNDFLAQKLSEQNWDGHIIHTPGDYLMIVDANVASLKTDAVMKRLATYSLQQVNDDYMVDLTLRYTNTGTFDWKTTRYNSYTRIYTSPENKLISADGVQVVEQTENNKNVFGFYWTIEPGTTKTIHLKYLIPTEKIKKFEDTLPLYVQKQPGSNLELQIDANSSNMIKSVHSNELGNIANITYPLIKDTQINLLLVR